MPRVDALQLASQAMPGLAASTGLTVLLTVLGDGRPTIIRWERSYMPFFTSLAIGSVLPLTGSASGRAILAFMPERVRERLLRSIRDERMTAAELALRFEKIRKRNYDTADSTVVPGLAAISAPILNLQNEATASLTLIGARSDISEAGTAVTGLLLDAAQKISSACGSDRLFRAKGRHVAD